MKLWRIFAAGSIAALAGCSSIEPSPNDAAGRRGASPDNTPASAAGATGEGSGLGTGTNSPSDTATAGAQPQA